MPLVRGTAPRAVNAAGWIVFCVLVVLLLGQLGKGVDPQDEGQFLTYPWLIAHGLMPYRDIWMSYPPGTYLVIAGFMKLGLPGLPVERGLAVLAFLGYALLVNRLITGTFTRFSWVGAILTYCLVFMSSDVRAYPWLLGLPLVVLGFWRMSSHPTSSSLLFLLAGTLRFEFAVAGFAAMLLFGFLSPPPARRPVLLAAAGLALGTAALYGVLQVLTSGYAFNEIVLDQVLGVEGERALPLFPPQFSSLGWPVLAAALLGPPLVIWVAHTRDRRDLVAGTLGVFLLTPHFFQRADSSHLFSLAALTVPWLLICLAALYRSSDDRGSSRWPHRAIRLGISYIAVGCAMWSFFIVAAYGVYLSPFSPLSSVSLASESRQIEHAGSRTIIGWDAQTARDDAQVIAYVHRHAAPHDSVFITPLTLDAPGHVPFYYTMTDLYYTLGLRPAARFLEMQGGVSDEASVQREINREIQHCTWVVLLRGGHWYTGAPAYYPKTRVPFDRTIHRDFRSVVQNATYIVMRRR